MMNRSLRTSQILLRLIGTVLDGLARMKRSGRARCRLTLDPCEQPRPGFAERLEQIALRNVGNRNPLHGYALDKVGDTRLEVPSDIRDQGRIFPTRVIHRHDLFVDGQQRIASQRGPAR